MMPSQRTPSPALLLAWLAPSLLGVAVFFVAPVAALGWLGTQQWDLLTPPRWAATYNLTTVLIDLRFWRSLLVTVGIGGSVLVTQLTLGLVLAKLLTTHRRGATLFRTVLLVPWMIAPLSVGVIARWFVAPADGIIARLAGHRIDAIVDPVAAPVIVVVVVVWQGTGFVALIYSGALLGVPQDLRAAAALDGAGRWRTLVDVEVPLVRRTTLFLVVTGTIQAFSLYDVIVPLTGGGPDHATETISALIVSAAWETFDIGRAALISLIVAVVVLALVIIQWVYFKRKESR